MKTLTPLAPPGVLQYVHILTSMLINNWCRDRAKFTRIVAMTNPYPEVWSCVVTYLATIATRDQRALVERNGEPREYELRLDGRRVEWADALPIERAYGEFLAALIESDTPTAVVVLEHIWVDFPDKRDTVLTAVAHGAHNVMHH